MNQEKKDKLIERREILPRSKQLHSSTLYSKMIHDLAEKPQTKDELGYYPNNKSTTGMIDRVRAPMGSSSAKSRKAKSAKTVYFLVGDERRAIRKFISENYDYVESCVSDKNNPILGQWDEVMTILLYQEWQLVADYE